MDQERAFSRSKLTTPRAAAVAGILFSVLLILSLALIRISVPNDPRDAWVWLAGGWNDVRLALNLLPFSSLNPARKLSETAGFGRRVKAQSSI